MPDLLSDPPYILLILGIALFFAAVVSHVPERRGQNFVARSIAPGTRVSFGGWSRFISSVLFFLLEPSSVRSMYLQSELTLSASCLHSARLDARPAKVVCSIDPGD
jgi:hypothetical protein